MTPRCSNRRTRWCTADTDRPTFSARSVYDNRPSAVRAATIARSISSTPGKYPQGCRVRRAPVRHAGEWTRRAATDQELTMKFAMLLNGDETEFNNVPPEEMDARLKEIFAWFEKWGPAGKIADPGVHLQPSGTAKTVRPGPDGRPVVTDGPYLEL